jgi:hypothetical protein
LVSRKSVSSPSCCQIPLGSSSGDISFWLSSEVF